MCEKRLRAVFVVFSFPCACLDARFAIYAKNWSSESFQLPIEVEEDPMYGEALHLGYQQPGRPLGGRIGKPGAVRDLPRSINRLDGFNREGVLVERI